MTSSLSVLRARTPARSRGQLGRGAAALSHRLEITLPAHSRRNAVTASRPYAYVRSKMASRTTTSMSSCSAAESGMNARTRTSSCRQFTLVLLSRRQKYNNERPARSLDGQTPSQYAKQLPARPLTMTADSRAASNRRRGGGASVSDLRGH